MKSQTQHIGNYSNVFDYSSFGAPLDGRTIENIFHQEEFTTFTVMKTIYVLEETFDVASDWQDVASYSQISYPSGKMEVKNPSSFMRLIGAKKGFTTGTGQHTVSFEMASLPSGVCAGLPGGGVVMGAQHNKTSDTLAGTGSYQIQSTSPHYVVVEIRNENNALVLKDSTNSTGTYSYAFSAPQGKEYTISFHNKSMCANLGYQIDNVLISYDTVEVVIGNTIIVTYTLFIINNDFENPVIEPNGAGVKIDGWTHYSPSTTLSVESHNGSDWLKVVSTNGTHGAHQGFSVEPGETYTFEIDLYRPTGMNKEINIVIWKNTGPSGAYTLHVLNTDGSNTFNYTATSSNIYIQIRQAGTYYLDNIRMYRTYQDTVFVGGFEMDMAYRYGYNTQERVPEIQKDHYTAPYWEYDPRVVMRWNTDPKPNPSISPYAINQGNPIWFSDPLGDTIRTDSEGYKIIQEGLTSTLGENNPFGYDETNQTLTFDSDFDRSKYSEEQLTFIDEFSKIVIHDKSTNVDVVNFEEGISLLGGASLEVFKSTRGTTPDGKHVFIARNPVYIIENERYVKAPIYMRGVSALHEIGGHARLRFTNPELSQIEHEELVERFETSFRQFYQIGTLTKREAKREGVQEGSPKYLGGKADIHGSIQLRIMIKMIESGVFSRKK